MCATKRKEKPEEEVYRKFVSNQAEVEKSKMEVDGAGHVGVFFSVVLLVLLFIYYQRDVDNSMNIHLKVVMMRSGWTNRL